MPQPSLQVINYSTIISDLMKHSDGKTPSEACGITIEGENKWKTLIQNASKNKAES